MSQNSQTGSVRDHIDRMKKARNEDPHPEDSEEGNNKIDESIANLMGFEWARIDAYTNRLAQDEEAVKKEAKERSKVDLSAFLAEQVQVREDRLEKEKYEESLWKYVIEEELEKFKHEDEEKEKHARYLGRNGRRREYR